MELNTNRANLLDPSTVVDEDTCLTAGEVNDVMREIFQETLHERWRRRTKAKAYAGLVLLTASTGLLLLAKVSLAGYPQVGAHCLSGLMSMLALWLLLSPWKTGYNQKPFVIMGAVACLFGSLSSALGLTGVVPGGAGGDRDGLQLHPTASVRLDRYFPCRHLGHPGYSGVRHQCPAAAR